MTNMLRYLFNTILTVKVACNDAPQPWQIGFQDGGSTSFEGIVELHDQIMFYLIVILLGVGWMLSSTIRKFHSYHNQIVHKYHNHGTLIELIWTITPAIVLIAIAFPSFKLLYLMDAQSVSEILVCANTLMSVAPIFIKDIKTTCTSLVTYGTFGASIGLRLT